MKQKTKEYLKPLIISILAVTFQYSIYMLCKLIAPEPTLIGNAIDNKIPFNIYFIIPYTFWYILLFMMPLIFYKKDKKDFTRYILSYLTVSILADIIYIFYPTTVIRPEISQNQSILHYITNIIFQIDSPPENCFPSLHCAVSFLWILFILEKNKYTFTSKLLTISVNILIILSTLFIKQHVFIDTISGITLGIIGYLIIKLFNKHIPHITNKILTKKQNA